MKEQWNINSKQVVRLEEGLGQNIDDDQSVSSNSPEHSRKLIRFVKALLYIEIAFLLGWSCYWIWDNYRNKFSEVKILDITGETEPQHSFNVNLREETSTIASINFHDGHIKELEDIVLKHGGNLMRLKINPREFETKVANYKIEDDSLKQNVDMQQSYVNVAKEVEPKEVNDILSTTENSNLEPYSSLDLRLTSNANNEEEFSTSRNLESLTTFRTNVEESASESVLSEDWKNENSEMSNEKKETIAWSFPFLPAVHLTVGDEHDDDYYKYELKSKVAESQEQLTEMHNSSEQSEKKEAILKGTEENSSIPSEENPTEEGIAYDKKEVLESTTHSSSDVYDYLVYDEAEDYEDTNFSYFSPNDHKIQDDYSWLKLSDLAFFTNYSSVADELMPKMSESSEELTDMNNSSEQSARNEEVLEDTEKNSSISSEEDPTEKVIIYNKSKEVLVDAMRSASDADDYMFYDEAVDEEDPKWPYSLSKESQIQDYYYWLRRLVFHKINPPVVDELRFKSEESVPSLDGLEELLQTENIFPTFTGNKYNSLRNIRSPIKLMAIKWYPMFSSDSSDEIYWKPAVSSSNEDMKISVENIENEQESSEENTNFKNWELLEEAIDAQRKNEASTESDLILSHVVKDGWGPLGIIMSLVGQDYIDKEEHIENIKKDEIVTDEEERVENIRNDEIVTNKEEHIENITNEDQSPQLKNIEEGKDESKEMAERIEKNYFKIVFYGLILPNIKDIPVNIEFKEEDLNVLMGVFGAPEIFCGMLKNIISDQYAEFSSYAIPFDGELVENFEETLDNIRSECRTVLSSYFEPHYSF